MKKNILSFLEILFIMIAIYAICDVNHQKYFLVYVILAYMMYAIKRNIEKKRKEL